MDTTSLTNDDPVGVFHAGLALLSDDLASFGTAELDLLGDIAEGLAQCSLRARTRQCRLAALLDALPLVEALEERNAVDAALTKAEQALTEFELFCIAVKKACGLDFDDPLTPRNSGRPA